MSGAVAGLVFSRKLGSQIRKAVLVYFAERAGDDGSGIWASKNTMADEIECGRSTLIRTINELVSEGLLRVVGERRHKNGATVEYDIDLDAVARLPMVEAAKKRPEYLQYRDNSEPVPQRDPSRSGTQPVPLRDPYPSRSGTQTFLGTVHEPSLSFDASEHDPFDEFNKIANTAGWPQVQSRTPERLKAAKARMKDCGGFANWREALNRAAASKFLSGERTGSTPATFDWLNKKANFTKLMEGNYDNRSARKPHRRDTRFDPGTDPVALAARNRRASWQDRTGS